MNRYAVAPRPLAGVLLVLVALSLLAVTCGPDGRARIEGLARVQIGDLVVGAEVPVGEGFYQGLGGRESIGEDRGMLFVFPQVGRNPIWMKDMRFAIDIIWISEDRRVVDLEAEAPPPPPGSPDSQVQIYAPETDARYVLEVRAGLAAEKGVRVGDAVEIELP